MSDPLEDRFRDFASGTPDMSPASPAEIRHRGDRMRRRRTALAAAGAALAVALIVTPLAVLVTGGDDEIQPAPSTPTVTDPPSEEPTTPPTDPAPTDPATTGIPEGFPLTPAGWATVDESQVQDGRLDACDRRPEAGAALDRLTREITSPVTLYSRELQLFADDAAAVDYAGSVRSVVERCPEPDPGLSLVVTPGDLSDDAFTATVGGDGAGLVTAIHVVRVGTLVLVDYSLEEGDDPSGLSAASERALAPVVAAMEELAGGGADPDDGGTEAGVPIDEDLVDMTGDGGSIDGPGPRAEGAVEVSPCDRAAWPVTGVERLAVRTTGPEYEESRELVVFADADAAVAAMADLRSAVTGCPTEINEADPTSNQEQAWDVQRANTGYEDSATFSLTYTDGLPGGEIWQFTRVGRAIIAVSTGGEYSRQPSSLRFAVRRLTAVTALMTPAMCEYTEAGC